MPFQSIFINAFQNDIENSHLWQQTAAALQANKFIQVTFFLREMFSRWFTGVCVFVCVCMCRYLAIDTFLHSHWVSFLCSHFLAEKMNWINKGRRSRSFGNENKRRWLVSLHITHCISLSEILSCLVSLLVENAC